MKKFFLLSLTIFLILSLSVYAKGLNSAGEGFYRVYELIYSSYNYLYGILDQMLDLAFKVINEMPGVKETKILAQSIGIAIAVTNFGITMTELGLNNMKMVPLKFVKPFFYLGLSVVLITNSDKIYDIMTSLLNNYDIVAKNMTEQNLSTLETLLRGSNIFTAIGLGITNIIPTLIMFACTFQLFSELFIIQVKGIFYRTVFSVVLGFTGSKESYRVVAFAMNIINLYLSMIAVVLIMALSTTLTNELINNIDTNLFASSSEFFKEAEDGLVRIILESIIFAIQYKIIKEGWHKNLISLIQQ